MENRLFAIACPFGGENRRILSVYKCLIINKMRFNVHLLFSLLRSFYHLLLWFLCQKFIFWYSFFGRMTFKKMTRGIGLMVYVFCLIIILFLLTLRKSRIMLAQCYLLFYLPICFQLNRLCYNLAVLSSIFNMLLFVIYWFTVICVHFAGILYVLLVCDGTFLATISDIK